MEQPVLFPESVRSDFQLAWDRKPFQFSATHEIPRWYDYRQHGSRDYLYPILIDLFQIGGVAARPIAQQLVIR